jgi:hypothetical protein
MALMKDLSGQKFSMLTAVGFTRTKKGILWHCVCECGGTREVTCAALTKDHTRSCGCTHKGRTHGHTRGAKQSLTYKSWTSMNARCTQPSNPAFKYYQSNGITICERWRKFENFLADMGERPGLEFSIDRHPNKMGDYEPGNCRWATKQEQANNRVTNKIFTYKGREMTFADLVRETGLDKEFLRHRLLRAGWSVEKAVNTPPSPGQRNLG